MSIGLISVNVAAYSTLPRALRGANWISVMMALCGSLGLISPNAVPTSFSYWPTLANVWLEYVGDSLVATTILVTRASACIAVTTAKASKAGSANRPRARPLLSDLMMVPPMSIDKRR